jgi:trans-feruloyl-CoA hydratase/vanillin synthase
MNGPAYETIRIDHDDGIAWLIMNRPEKRNAMNPQMHYEMDRALPELEADPDVKAVVLTGAGEAYCAGQDLKEYFRGLDDNPAERRRAGEASERWRNRRLATFNKPTIAMVNGYCIGGGFTQTLCCDFALAAEDATFCLSEVNWGILPGGLVSKKLVEALRFRDAMLYACTGRTFDGRRAAEIGMVNFAVPKDKLREETVALARELMEKNPEVLRATKHALRAVRTMSDDQAFDYLAAKSAEIKMRDKENAYHHGLKQFIDDKSYKPTFSAYDREKASRE